LLYGTVGVAFADMTMGVCDNGNIGNKNPCSTDDLESVYSGTNVGLIAGLGFELAVNDRTNLFAEYSVVGFPKTRGDQDSSGGTSNYADHTTFAHLAKFGLTYSFDDVRKTSPSPAHDWSGFYAGVHTETRLQYISAGLDDVGGSGSDLNSPIGISFGRNWQSGNVVYGLEGDATVGAGETRVEWYDGEYASVSDWEWSSTIRGRVGITSGDALLYVTGGVAIAEVNAWACDDGSDCSSTSDNGVESAIDDILLGLTVGVGVEYAFSSKWSAVAEYRYTGFPSKYGENVDGSDYVSDFTNYAHGVKMGLNYSF